MIVEGHVQGLSNVRALGELGIPVYVIDSQNCIARYSKYCRKFFICPGFLSKEFPEFLVELGKNENISGWILVPSNDHAAYSIARCEDRLKPYFISTTPPLHTIEKIYDKAKLIHIAKNAGVPVPVTYSNTSSPPVLHDPVFPLILKGRYGLSFFKTVKKKAFTATSEEELSEHIIALEDQIGSGNIIIQELIPFNEKHRTLSYVAFCKEGEILAYWMGIKLREHPFNFGTATLAESINIRECHDQSIPLLKELNYSGVCEIEYLFDQRDRKYKLIEINPRTWLWVSLARRCGVDFAVYLYNSSSNIPIDFPGNYLTGIKWVNLITDIPFAIKYILKGQLKVSDYLKSLKGKKVLAVFSKKDILPSFAFLFLLPRLIRSRT